MLATVKGDVHDIGKNLVDIILTNNGYKVVNLGIKQPITAILEAAEEHDADVIGMSGLLVKSTVVMKENLEELNSARDGRALAGHARRRRADPRVRRGGPGRALRRRGPLRPRRLRGPAADGRRDGGQARRSRVRSCRRCASAGSSAGRGLAESTSPRTSRRGPTWPPTTRCPTPPFWGDRVVKGIPLADYASLPRRAGDVHGPVGAEGRRAATGRRTRSSSRPRAGRGCAPGWTGSRPRDARGGGRLRLLPCYSEGNDLVVLDAERRLGRDRTASPSRGSGVTGTCASPTSSGRRSPASSTWSRFSW